MFENLKVDFSCSSKRKWSLLNCMLLSLSSKGFAAVALYRMAYHFQKKNHKLLAKIIHNRNIKKYGCDISSIAVIGKGFAIGHPVGVVIGGARIGERCLITTNVTIGAKDNITGDNMVIIGDDCYIGAGARIVGNLKVGNNVKIGANAVLVRDTPDNCTIVGVPGKVVNGG